jgi:hypothetical protein
MNIVQLFLLLTRLVFPITEQTGIEKILQNRDTFPVPPTDHKTLFYLQRSLDVNSIIYEMNTDKNGKPDLNSPVNIFWHHHSTGERSPLSAPQRKFAYGVKWVLISAEKSIFKINLAAYKKVDLYITQATNKNKFLAIAYIKGRSVVVKRIFVNITGGTPLHPKVAWIKLFGHDLISGEATEEKFIP